jgi:predicted flap endonuclease-1-like 5' DNA nuclease
MSGVAREAHVDEPSNDIIAARLERVAELLEGVDANPFRVRSYRRAAGHLRDWDRAASAAYREHGSAALRAIEGVGEGLAATIAEFIETRRLKLLDRLESEIEPEKLLQRLPGVGPKLAHRLHDALGVVTLEELEQAAHDGRLARVDGVGSKKAETIRAALAGMLGPRARRGNVRPLADRPSVETLLAVDADYRSKAGRGELERIAPRRFNPDHKRWLPIHHCEHDGWQFTALYSNTQRAHELGRTGDWVVVYYHRDRHEDQCTVVTSTAGPYAGRRVVRGREDECRALFRRVAGGAAALR